MALRSTPTTEKEIAQAFARIENELLASMVRNFERHQVEEVAEGFQWAQWQVLQLQSLDEYARLNARKHGKEFDKLNSVVEKLVKDAYNGAGAAQEREILKAIQKGFLPYQRPVRDFFETPHERLDALINAIHSDLMQAEYATLRRATDIYRATVFDAQLYAQSGAGTYAQAIDMATKDFLRKGIDGIIYKNGSRHTIREYSQMAIRTSVKRAALTAEGDMRKDWGINTVIVDYRDDACPECMEWVGEVLIDDVYGDGTAREAKDLDYHLLSEAMDAGLFHPNCRDTTSTYFPGVSDLPERPSKAAQSRSEAREELEQSINVAQANERQYERLSEFSLSPDNQAKYEAKAEEWGERVAEVKQEVATIGKSVNPIATPYDTTEQVRESIEVVHGRLSNTVNSIEKKTADIAEVMKRGGVDTADALKSLDLAEGVFQKAAEVEGGITADIVSAVNEVGGNMYGLDFRLKQPESMAGKIAEKGARKGEYAKAADKITDAVRYTMVFDKETFTADYQTVRARLEKMGYNEVRNKNFYTLYKEGESEQKAVQCLYRDKNGYTFELQFHTIESQGAKELNHPLYEEARAATTPPERVAELNAQMREIGTHVPDPDGVYNIASFDLTKG